MGDKGDKSAACPPKGRLVETRCQIKGLKSAIVPFAEPRSRPKSWTGSGVFPAKSEEVAVYLSLPPTRHDLTQGQKLEGLFYGGDKGEGRSVTSRDSNPAGQCCSSAHFVQCKPDEASSFTNRNVGPGTYASLRLKLDTLSSAIHGWQRRQG